MAEVDLSILFLKAVKSFSKSPLRLTDHLIIGLFIKWTYTKYVGGGIGGFYRFFKKNFVAQEAIDLNISWSSNFLGKYFMAPPINFSFLFKAYL